jgi:hypothetical protein
MSRRLIVNVHEHIQSSREGAKAIKLYLSHGELDTQTSAYLFHSMAMDDLRMLPVYAWCQAKVVPVMYHVNPDKPGFAEKFNAVLSAVPDLSTGRG